MSAIVAHFFSTAQCAHTLNMIDTYGDGWNGSTVDITVNGAAVQTGVTLASGSAGLQNFTANTGDAVALSNWVSGSPWDGEIQWNITDGGGNIISSGVFGDVTGGVGACPNCPPPSGITLANLGSTSADISWTAGGTETEWYFEINGVGSSVTTTTQSVTGLTPNDSVFVNISAICAVGDTSGILSGFFITYPPAPNAPSGVTCSSGTPGVAITDDFEGGLNWTGDVGTTGNGIWKIDANGTPSGGTGPSAAYSGSNYMYYEASVGGTDTATLVSSAVDLTAAANSAELSFWMHAAGATVGTLEVGVSTSSTGPFTSVFTFSGNYQTGSNDTWIPVGVDLTSYIGQNIYLGFTVYRLPVTNPLGYAWSSDFAIDLVEVNSCFSCLAPSGLTASNVAATSADVSWTAGGTETEWFLIVNGAGTTQTSTTASLTGLMANTAYTAQVHAVCAPGDTSVASPALTFNTLCDAALGPTNETFDAGFSNCWSQETTDSLDWLVGSGGTPSGGTGPSDDFTGITTGTSGNYMYIETSVPVAHGDVATMYSEVIDISGLTNPELRFLNHMYGSAMGTMDVDLWDASTGTVVGNVFTHSGDRGNQWNEELIMLSTTATLVQFSITATLDSNVNGQTWPGDMAIDEFGVREAAANDLALVAAAVASGCDLTATEPIELWVVNQGLVAESAFDLSYAVNGGTPVVESITSTVNPGDTLKYVFTATADMTADGVYNLDFACVLSTDNDLADNALSMMAENYDTPMAPVTMGDTICNGDTAMVSADEYSYWYDAATGGNLVGEGDEIDVMPTATTSYYAEAAATAGHFEDFDSYNVGDYIVASDPSNWAVWPGGTPGGAYDMQIDDAQGNGGNSLRVDNADGTDVVLEFGEAFSSGYFYYSMDMYIVGDGYINFQEQVTIGAAWNMSITMIGGVLDVSVDNASVLTGAYSTTPTGGPVWNTFEFECDYSTGTWEVFVNGTSQGTFVNADPVASVNIYPGAGVNYYLDNVEWGALKDDACRSASRTEAVVTVEDCSNILELAKGDLDVYPNPNNGSFTVENSVDIVKLTITDVHGKIVQSINEINLNKVDVDLTDLEKGMYMINIETKKGTITESVIVQ